MVSFEEHLQQAKSNLSALRVMLDTDHFDWQVTISFYVALHLLSAHMAFQGVHVSTHKKARDNLLSLAEKNNVKADSDIFSYYDMLEGLSREARYLHNGESPKNAPVQALFVKHGKASDALRSLNNIMIYFSRKYEADFETTKVKSPQVAKALGHSVQYFLI